MPVDTVVHANRMVLMKLQKRLAMAKRGHTLLKHKLDELIHLFQKEMRGLNAFREELENELQMNYALFVVGMGLFRGDYQNVFLAAPVLRINLDKTITRLLNLKVPDFQVNIAMETPPFSLIETNADTDKAVREMKELMEKMVQLAQRQRRLELLIREIRVTRRRVNALEYELIPRIESQVAYIKMKLDEVERADINRLMRIKSIIRKEK